MSKILDVKIKCDGFHKDCELFIMHNTDGHSAAYQRQEGARRGWIKMPMGARDYCPICYNARAFKKV